MLTSLEALQQRVDELDRLADEVFGLAERVHRGEPVQDELSREGQRWYRGARAFLVQHESSGLTEFDACYDTSKRPDAVRGASARPWRRMGDIEDYITYGSHGATGAGASEYFTVFSQEFRKARALAVAVVEEVASRSFSLHSLLSLEIAADELEAADEFLTNWGGHEAIMRAAGVVARVALERHLFTLAETKGVQIVKNPPTKPKVTADDALASLQRANVITAIQKRQLEDLFTVGNACAHPRDTVSHEDVRRLITEGKQIAAVLT